MMLGTNLEREREAEPKVLRVLHTQIIISSRTRHNLWVKADGAIRSNTYCGEEISIRLNNSVWKKEKRDNDKRRFTSSSGLTAATGERGVMGLYKDKTYYGEESENMSIRRCLKK